MIFPKVLAGDFEGSVEIKIGALWTGPKASKFKGFNMYPGFKYKPEDIKRIVYLSDESSKSFLSGAVRGVAGGLLLGGVGAIAGVMSAGSKTKIANYGVELMDGKKFIMAQSPNNKHLLCMIYSATYRLVELGLNLTRNQANLKSQQTSACDVILIVLAERGLSIEYKKVESIV